MTGRDDTSMRFEQQLERDATLVSAGQRISEWRDLCESLQKRLDALQPSLGTNNGLAGSADRHKGSGEVCGPVKMGSTPIGSAVSPVAPRGDYIRTCANGHASLNAANWECPWCLLDEARRELAELRAAPRIYDAVADAVCEIADAAKAAFEKAGVDPGEWDSDDIVQDVKRGIVSAIEQLAAARSATGKRLPTAAEVRGILKDDDAPSLDTTAKP